MPNILNSCLAEENNIMTIIEQISKAVENGKLKQIKELVPQAIAEGYGAQTILDDGLLHGMGIVGDRFTKGEAFVPEVLVSARTMNKGVEFIKPLLAEGGSQIVGKACIGTVQGDMHDIGKNIVKLMLESKNFEVIDLEVDVPPEVFIQTAMEEECDLICCSALLTTTMPVMRQVVEAAEAAGIRDKVIIMIGGAPVTQEFCDEIGADAYTDDGNLAAVRAVELVTAKKQAG